MGVGAPGGGHASAEGAWLRSPLWPAEGDIPKLSGSALCAGALVACTILASGCLYGALDPLVVRHHAMIVVSWLLRL